MVAMTSTTASGAQALACAVAVLGDDTPAAVAIGLAGLGAEDGERAADVLTAAGVLAPRRPLRFAQPAMRAGLYACLPPGVRAIAHRRAVRILTEAGADPLAVVRHACAVEPSRDPFVAAALATAGRHALAAGATREASLLLERAVAEPPPEEQRARLRALLGHALTLLGDPRAPALTSQALATAEPHDRPRMAAELVDALWLSDRADAALALMREIAGVEPQGLAAAQAARDGSLPAPEIARLARAGIDGSTAFERCLATAALIACDELEAARAGLDSNARLAASRGADAEGALLARLRGRLEALECGRPDPGPPLPGPDPGIEPWRGWIGDAVAIKRFGTPSARVAAALASGDLKSLARAVELVRGSPRPAQHAHALLAFGRAKRQAGCRRVARDALREALVLAQRLGADDVAREAKEELCVAGARPRRELLTGPESLTPSERRVAEAAAAGATNREVAAQLFLSSKTVEMHLGRVYRKLEISSRGELAGALGMQVLAA